MKGLPDTIENSEINSFYYNKVADIFRHLIKYKDDYMIKSFPEGSRVINENRIFRDKPAGR